MEISSKDKYKLRSLAHSLKPSVLIGKEGASINSINSINKALDSNELIKIKFNSFKNEKKTISKIIERSCNAIIIGIKGNIVIFYKKNQDIEKRKYIQ